MYPPANPCADLDICNARVQREHRGTAVHFCHPQRITSTYFIKLLICVHGQEMGSIKTYQDNVLLSLQVISCRRA